jgi:hypothetical protein
MTKFGTLSLPAMQSVNEKHARNRQEVPLPGRAYAYRKDRGGLGAQFSYAGTIYPADESIKNQISALADGTARILDLERTTLALLESCLRYQIGPTWTDYTAESQSTLGTPFTLLGATSDYGYFGHREKFNNLTFSLTALGTYGALLWETCDGDGTWTTLAVTDGTSGLHQNGAVIFTPPSYWKQDTVNSVANKFWVRVSAASVTTPATIYNIQINPVYLCIMMDPTFVDSVSSIGEIPYTCTFLQQENP